MATFHSIEEYVAVMDARAKRMRKMQIKTASNVATYFQAMAVKMAPLQTGELIKGIKKDRIGEGKYRVSSTVPGDFPYNLWVNRSGGFGTLFFPKGGIIPPKRSRTGGYVRAFPPNSFATYGDGSHEITGTPRFFSIARQMARRKMKTLARLNVRKALEAVSMVG